MDLFLFNSIQAQYSQSSFGRDSYNQPDNRQNIDTTFDDFNEPISVENDDLTNEQQPTDSFNDNYGSQSPVRQSLRNGRYQSPTQSNFQNDRQTQPRGTYRNGNTPRSQNRIGYQQPRDEQINQPQNQISSNFEDEQQPQSGGYGTQDQPAPIRDQQQPVVDSFDTYGGPQQQQQPIQQQPQQQQPEDQFEQREEEEEINQEVEQQINQRNNVVQGATKTFTPQQPQRTSVPVSPVSRPQYGSQPSRQQSVRPDRKVPRTGNVQRTPSSYSRPSRPQTSQFQQQPIRSNGYSQPQSSRNQNQPRKTITPQQRLPQQQTRYQQPTRGQTKSIRQQNAPTRSQSYQQFDDVPSSLTNTNQPLRNAYSSGGFDDSQPINQPSANQYFSKRRGLVSQQQNYASNQNNNRLTQANDNQGNDELTNNDSVIQPRRRGYRRRSVNINTGY